MKVAIYEISNLVETFSKRNENILIHCKCAISRSPTAVIGYLILKNEMTYNNAKIFIMKNEILDKHLMNGKHLWEPVLKEINEEKNIPNKLEFAIQLYQKLNDQENQLMEMLKNRKP